MSQSSAESPAKAPTHIAFQVREGSQKSHWTRIGATWTHKDGNGLSIQLESLPLDGRISLRSASEN